MDVAHLLEAAMLVCFGFSWPINVRKAYKAGTTKGTSLAFIFLIITGYVCGIAAKMIKGQYNYVLVVYFLNLAIVMMNVFVYIRNKGLDRKRETVQTKAKIIELQKKYKNANTKIQEDDMNYKVLNTMVEKNAVVLFGGAVDRQIPVTELAESFDFNFKIYNRSDDSLSIKDAAKFFQNNISEMLPEGIIIHLGDNDAALFRSNPADFDKYYLDLLASIKATNKNTRIAMASVMNLSGDKNIAEMNRHIKNLADSEKCAFVNLDNAKLWNPNATRASIDFAYSMGLRARKPLANVAEILYSYAYLEIPAETTELVG